VGTVFSLADEPIVVASGGSVQNGFDVEKLQHQYLPNEFDMWGFPLLGCIEGLGERGNSF